MRISRRLLRLVGAVLFCGVLALTLYLDANGQLRFLSNESRLSPFETRIESVEEEFMRRSPALQENFARFDQCVRRPTCNTAEILQERNRLLQTMWPDLLARLLVADDWGEGSLTISRHQQFNQHVQRAGGSERAQQCRPILEYRLMSASNTTLYSYQGLRCRR